MKNSINIPDMVFKTRHADRCFKVDIADVDWEDGSDNTAGIGTYVYFAPISDIETLPTPILDDSTGSGSFEDLVTITDNIVMKPGKSFQKMYVTLETGKVDSDSQGEIDGMSFMNKLEFVHPGNKAKSLGFAQYAKNTSLVFLAPDLDGDTRLIGHKNYPAKMVSSPFTSGAKSSDRKQGTFTFQSARKGPAPIFKGTIAVSGVGSGVDANSDGFQDIVFAD